ncbi:MAG TPA: hypothetical protein DCG57_04405 [Candidatus Riflebacteria bacterium]|nr:hypothetical protein [Candidatus Riflebacteria bacterium]
MIKSNRSVARFVAALLDRIDRQGSLPTSFSLNAAECPDVDAIKLFFGHEYVRTDDSGRIKLNLDRYLRHLPDAIETFYTALKRKRRSIRDENAELLARLLRVIDTSAGKVTSAVLLAFIADERAKACAGRGDLLALAKKSGCPAVAQHLDCLQRGFVALYESEKPLRLSHFSRAVTGDTKSCRSGTPLLRQFADILYRYDAKIKFEIDLLESVGSEQRQRAVLDLTRLQPDGSATQILVFGDLVFSKGPQRFEYVAEHARLAEPVVLTLAQLDAARVERAPRRLVSIENETSFYDYIEGTDPCQEIVVCSMGQANRLLIKFLKTLSGHTGEFLHWGDIDRSGVLILDSMRRRTGLGIKPLNMDVATFEKHRSHALPLSGSESDLLTSLLRRRPEIICADLLRHILKSRAWLEQENITAHRSNLT